MLEGEVLRDDQWARIEPFVPGGRKGTLMARGVLVRGYVTRGPIAHMGERFFGTGYHRALDGEPGVTAFGKSDEKGTPFVEIDPTVRDYILADGDECAREMFDRYVHTDEAVSAIFPFKCLEHSFMIAGFGAAPLDAGREKAANARLRTSLERYKAQVMAFVDPADDRAMRKVRHYLAALDDQIAVSQATDAFIDQLCKPFGRDL